MNDQCRPKIDSELLQGIAESLERRGKAIRFHGTLTLSREMEESGERLNVDFSGIPSHRVRLSVWSDGAIWLNVCKPGPRRAGGWEYNRELRGQFQREGPTEIVTLLESTIASPTEADRIWQDLLVPSSE